MPSSLSNPNAHSRAVFCIRLPSNGEKIPDICSITSPQVYLTSTHGATWGIQARICTPCDPLFAPRVPSGGHQAKFNLVSRLPESGSLITQVEIQRGVVSLKTVWGIQNHPRSIPRLTSGRTRHLCLGCGTDWQSPCLLRLGRKLRRTFW